MMLSAPEKQGSRFFGIFSRKRKMSHGSGFISRETKVSHDDALSSREKNGL